MNKDTMEAIEDVDQRLKVAISEVLVEEIDEEVIKSIRESDLFTHGRAKKDMKALKEI